jgi:hypothetical protein
LIQLGLQVLTGAILLAVGGRELSQLLRHPRDPALRVLVPGLIGLALAASLGIPELTLPVMRHLLGHWFGWVIDGCWYVMVFAFAAFFVVAAPGTDPAVKRRLVLRELLLCVVAFAAVAAVDAAAPDLPRALLFRSWSTYADTVLTAAYLVPFSFAGIWRGIRYRRRVTHPWLRRSLAIVLAGAAAMTIGVNVSHVLIQVGHALLGPTGPAQFSSLKIVYVTGLLGGQTLLALGLVLPGAVELGARVARIGDLAFRRRAQRQIRPLWAAVTTVFPYVVLEDSPSPAGEFPRMISETSDGLAQLAPYLPTAGLNVAASTTGLREPREAAVVLERALRARAEGAPRADPPYPRLEPEFATWRERARWMARLSQCWAGLEEPDAVAGASQVR